MSDMQSCGKTGRGCLVDCSDSNHDEAIDSPPCNAQQPTANELLDQLESVEARLEQVRRSLTHSHRLTTLGTLAAVIAHEYNNILTPMMSYAQLALNRPDDPKLMLKAVEKALSGAEKAAHISSSVLGFAREHDEQSLADLRQTIDESIACLARDPEKDGVKLHIDVPEVKPAISSLSLQQVFVNLILNAKKAMRRTGGRIDIVGQLNEHKELELTVRDSGPGVPAEIVDQLFEPFVTRPNHETSTQRGGQPKGTGLGLSICRELISQAGGSISYRAEPGQGACFVIKLPVAQQARSAA